MGKTKYKCKENDCEIIIYTEDGAIDELHIGVRGMGEWTVIGYKDLRKALKKATRKVIFESTIEAIEAALKNADGVIVSIEIEEE